MKFFPLLWSNLKRKKLRTALTLLSILVAFLLFGFLSAIEQALTAGATVAGADRLVVRHKVSIIQMMPISYRDRIAKIPGVALVVHNTWFGGIYQDPKNFFAQVPVEPEPFLEMFPEFVLSPEAKQKWLATRTGAIVGRQSAEKFGWKVGDRIPIQATIWPKADGGRTWEFDLVGIFEAGKKETDTTGMYFRYDYFDETRAYGKGLIGWFNVRVADPKQAEDVARRIDDEFANSPAETKTETEGAFVQGFAKQIGDIGKIMLSILTAVFFTILLVAGNTMAQAVRERTEELGVLKAIGFTNRRVMALVLGESMLLALLGGGVGLALSWALISSGNPMRRVFPIFFFPAHKIIIGAVLVLALGIVTGFLPALQAMRLRIADALRRM